MGAYTSNAAIAYDMQAPAYDYRGSSAPAPAARPQAPERPKLDVLTGAGREADQAVSPAFLHVIKTFCILAALFCAVGGIRVALSSVTAGTLNANAALSSSLEASAEESSNLEVMRSVYGASTRIRDLAASMLGMVPAEGGVTIDVSEPAAGATDAGAGAAAQPQAQTPAN